MVDKSFTLSLMYKTIYDITSRHVPHPCIRYTAMFRTLAQCNIVGEQRNRERKQIEALSTITIAEENFAPLK